VPVDGDGASRARRRVSAGARRARSGDYFWFTVLLSTVLVLSMLTFLVGEWMTVAVLAVPLLLGSLVLPVGQLVTLAVVVALTAALDTALALTAGHAWDAHRWADVVAVTLLSAVVVISAATRTDLGVAVTRGESMLVDLRDRFRADSTLPALPSGWHAEAAVRSAGGASFAGDFLVAALSEDQRFVEIAVVDVSGKGFAAGTRALSLSGALGGLLGAVPAEQFLPAANTYLMRQRWDEGFATAVHLLLDLSAGTFEVRGAGHPPAVQFHSGSGRWQVHTSEGPVLGLVDRARFCPRRGELLAGDVLLLYTDGLVETAQLDIARGIDALVGHAERLVASGFQGGAEQLIDSVATASDDRAVVLVHRR
jgi:hypothetical protein